MKVGSSRKGLPPFFLRSISREYSLYPSVPKAVPGFQRTGIPLRTVLKILTKESSLNPLRLILLLALPFASLLPVWRPAIALPGVPVDSPTNLWAPYGPRVANLQLNYYASEVSEFSDFEAGRLDLTDWPVAKAQYSSYDANPDFVLSPGQGQYGMFGVDFKYASSTWSAWGCNWQHGNSACGTEIREGFAHLIDRQSFVNDGPLAGAGQAIADPSPPAKDPSATPLTTQVTWDTLAGQNVSGIVHPPDVSAFHVAPNPGGFATNGSPDFCAARSHLIAANIGLRDDNRDCVIDSASPGLANIVGHPIRFMIRSDDPNRYALGIGLVNAINRLFGAAVVSPFIANIAQIGPIVFSSAPDGITDDWDMYTFGWNLPGPFPDHLRPLYSSVFASDQCGGQLNGETLNYGFLCIPSFDGYVNAASQTPDIGIFKANTIAAFNEFGKRVGNIPIYARGIRVAALRSMTGLVNARGASYPNFWTLLNGRNDTGYTPTNPLYRFGGGSNFIRWGHRQGTTQLNPFKAQTLWEFNIIGEVYDTLFAASPIQPANVMCWICDNYTPSFDSQGNSHFLIQLRQNLRWQDGVVLNASDVKFTLLNMREVPAAAISGNVQQLLALTILGSNLVDIAMRGQSISHLINLAGVPIIPRHLWELPGDLTYGDVGKANPAMTSTSYDMIVSGTFIGSGRFVCRSVFSMDFNRVGTGCSRNSDGSRGGQAVGPGGGIFLQAFDRTSEPGNSDPFLQYMRSYNPSWSTGTGTASESGQFQEFSWADSNNDGIVNLVDAVAIGACWHATGPTTQCPLASYNYWLKPAFHPGSPAQITSELDVFDKHLDEGWVLPFSWSNTALENVVPFTP